MNKLKYESYKSAYKLLNEAIENNDLLRSIAAIVVSESIIADRLQSFLMYKNREIFFQKGKEKKFVPTGTMVKECTNYFPKYEIIINSKNLKRIESLNLFKDLKNWLSIRNDICHGFVKTKPGTPTKEVIEFHKSAINAGQEGIKLTKLVIKWHKKQVQLTKKQK